MFFTIYKITNTINDKIYIGKHQTKNLNDGYLGSGKYLKRAINKYGIENFSKEILFVFESGEEMNSKEKEIVNEEYLTRDDVYNLCLGGQGGFGYIHLNGLCNYSAGRVLADKVLEKRYGEGWKKILSFKGVVALKEKCDNDILFKNELILKHRKSLEKARISALSDESKLKRIHSLSKINHQQGSKNSQFGTCWITNGSENKKIKKEDLYLWIEQGYNKGRK